MSGFKDTPRGTRITPEDTPSGTWQAETSQRETMEQGLMDLGAWLSERPVTAKKNLKPIRSAKLLQPGIYYNRGTGMVDRLYSPQHAALGHQMFRISRDPAASVEEIRRIAMEGS